MMIQQSSWWCSWAFMNQITKSVVMMFVHEHANWKICTWELLMSMLLKNVYVIQGKERKVWLSKVKIPHHLSFFYRDKAFLSDSGWGSHVDFLKEKDNILFLTYWSITIKSQSFNLSRFEFIETVFVAPYSHTMRHTRAWVSISAGRLAGAPPTPNHS